jgi:hypothetical protein
VELGVALIVEGGGSRYGEREAPPRIPSIGVRTASAERESVKATNESCESFRERRDARVSRKIESRRLTLSNSCHRHFAFSYHGRVSFLVNSAAWHRVVADLARIAAHSQLRPIRRKLNPLRPRPLPRTTSPRVSVTWHSRSMRKRPSPSPTPSKTCTLSPFPFTVSP